MPDLTTAYGEASRAVRAAWDTAVAPLLPPSVEPIARYVCAAMCVLVASALTARAVYLNENEELLHVIH